MKIIRSRFCKIVLIFFADLEYFALKESSSVTRNLKVALVESQSLSKVKDWKLQDGIFENRVSSLTPKTVKFLQSKSIKSCFLCIFTPCQSMKTNGLYLWLSYSYWSMELHLSRTSSKF